MGFQQKKSENSSLFASRMILRVFHLGQLDLWADVEGVGEIPLEDEVVCGVRERLNHHKTDLTSLIIGSQDFIGNISFKQVKCILRLS